MGFDGIAFQCYFFCVGTWPDVVYPGPELPILSVAFVGEAGSPFLIGYNEIGAADKTASEPKPDIAIEFHFPLPHISI